MCYTVKVKLFSTTYGKERNVKLKNNKKRRGSSAAVALNLIIVLLYGIFISRYLSLMESEGIGTVTTFLIAFVIIYVSLIVQIIIHEAGHLVFGLLSGYRFGSFRVLGLMIASENGKLKLRRLNIAGTGGQCLMIPPDSKRPEDTPAVLYNLGGVIFNTAASALFGVLCFTVPMPAIAATLVASLFGMGLYLALTNGIPMNTGLIYNDGANALSCMKSPAARRALVLQLRITAETAKGVRLKDMPEEWFAVPTDEEMKSPIISTIGVFVSNRLTDEHRFAEADALTEHLLSIDSSIAGVYRAVLTSDRMFFEMIGENLPERINAMCTKEQIAIMGQMKRYLSFIRTEYACALLCDDDAEKAREAEARFEKAAASHPFKSDVDSERELMDVARSMKNRKEAI